MVHLPKRKSKPLVSRKATTVGARSVRKVAPETSQRPVTTPSAAPTTPLAGLSDSEWDSLFCMAIRHHFEQEQTWVPSVLRTMPLLAGINDKTGRPCRIYVRPGKRIVLIETLS
jgi:hypothetical protein